MAYSGSIARVPRLRGNRRIPPTRSANPAGAKAGRKSILPAVLPLDYVSPYFMFASALLFAGIYTDLVIALRDGGVVPMVSALPGAIMMYFCRGAITPKTLYFLIIPPLAVFGFSTFAPEFSRLILNRIFVAGQVGYSMFIGYAACFCIGRLGKVRVNRILTILIPVFLLLAFLEITTSFRDVVTDYLLNYPRNYDFDAMLDRDQGMGGYRPKLFTSETSYVGVSAFMMLVAYLWSGKGAQRYITFGWFLLASLILIRSPIVVLALPVALATASQDRSLDANRSIYNLALIIGLLVLCTGLYLFASQIFAGRLAKVSSGQDYSLTYRTYGSFGVALNVLKQYPLFGIGPGSLVIARDTITSTLIQYGVPIRAVEMEWDKSINNGPSSFLLYFGLLGTALALAVTYIIIKRDADRVKLPLVVALTCYSLTYGAVYTPKFLVTVLVILMLAKLLATDVAQIPRPARRPQNGARRVQPPSRLAKRRAG